MKNKLKLKALKIITIGIIAALAFNLASPNFLNDKSTIRAFGDLTVDFHVPPLDPIFVVNNMAPGDFQSKPVDVTNGTSSRTVAVKGIRTGGVGADPKIETVLDIVIKDGTTSIYGTGSATGSKTVANFFADSSGLNGVQLQTLTPGQHKTYNFIVTFPITAGDDFQAKSVIFDLTFGKITGNNIVINEVYYQVDSAHGLDSPKDRGIESVNGNNVSVIIEGNGAGSTNIVNINIKQACKIVQTNNANFTNIVNINQNTGGNSANNNTGGSTSIITGLTNAIVNISNFANINIGSCGNKLGQNNEWIELFNPTDGEINLKNWTLTDNSGISRKITGNRKLRPGEFALLSKDNSTWNSWNEDPNALKIPLGNQIGDGLDNDGDRLILRNASGNVVDQLSYGDDTSVFPSPIPTVSLGASFERLTPGFDTDFASDFEEQDPPTPGN